MTDSLITTDIDFDAPGKQVGFLRLPHSVHRSAYGWIPVPLVVISNGNGPTVLMMSGNHGDEYEGQIALTKLAQQMSEDRVQGRIIILTMANFPAADAGLRTSPIDGGNLNRSFPGTSRGTPTQMIAHYIEEVLMPMADFAVDLHSGGTSLVYPPTLLRGTGQTKEEEAQLRALQQAFDLPYAWVFTGGGGRNSAAPTAMGAANRKGVVSIMAELGGGAQVSREVLFLAERGILRILHSLGICPDYRPDRALGTQEMHAQGSIYAYDAGLFEPYKDLLDTVADGETVGMIHHPDTPWGAPEPVRSTMTGIVLAKRALAQVRRGDAIYQIARDAG